VGYDKPIVTDRSQRADAAAKVFVELAVRAAVLVIVVTGHPFSYDVHRYWARMHLVSLHHLPYRDFLWEFPPLTVLVVLPARWLSHSAFTGVFALEMICAEYGSLVLLRRRLPGRAGTITTYWTWVGLPLAAQAWFRLDFLSVLFATWALLLVLEGRSAVWPVVLGFVAKLWPVVLGAVVAAQRQYRRTATMAAAVGAATAAWYAFSPAGFRAFLRYRHGSGLQIESLLGAPLYLAGAKVSSASDSYVVLRGRLGWVDPLLLALFALLVLGCVLLARRRPVRAVPLAGGLVVGLMVLSRILSPQYLVWALPFLALSWAEGERRATVLFALAAWVTAVLNWGYADFVAGNRALQVAVVIRNLSLVAAGVLLLRDAFGRRPSHAPADGGRRAAR
jgi:hypothetical protein